MSAKTNPVPKVPKKFCGLWIAWNHAQTKIVASGKTLPEAIAAAERCGEETPFFTTAPRAESRFVGGLSMKFDKLCNLTEPLRTGIRSSNH